jgi:hypothetical protein
MVRAKPKQSTMTQIKDLEALAPNTAIAELVLGVKAVYPPKTPKAPYNLVVFDATGETRLAAWSDVDLSDYKGQRITVRSTATRKGLDGLNVVYSDYNKRNELKLGKSGQIFNDAELEAGAGGRAPHAAVTSKSPIPGPSGGSGVAPYNATPAVAPKAFIFQNAQLMVEAINAAQWVAKQVEAITPDHLQAIASSLYISAERAGMARQFPTSEKKEVAPAPTIVKKDDEDDLGW